MIETKPHDYESLYDPPRSALGVPGVFRARVWHRVPLVVFFGAVAAFVLVMGGLCLTGDFPVGMSDAENRAGGVTFTALGLFLGAAAVVMMAFIVARRGPALRACREGPEIRLTGPSRVYGVPSAPKWFRLTWALLSGGPCRLPTLRIPWEAVVGVAVSGGSPWRDRALVVQWRPDPAGVVCQVGLPQMEIAAPVETVAAALRGWAGDENGRASLPGWET